MRSTCSTFFQNRAIVIVSLLRLVFLFPKLTLFSFSTKAHSPREARVTTCEKIHSKTIYSIFHFFCFSWFTKKRNQGEGQTEKHLRRPAYLSFQIFLVRGFEARGKTLLLNLGPRDRGFTDLAARGGVPTTKKGPKSNKSWFFLPSFSVSWLPMVNGLSLGRDLANINSLIRKFL